MTATTIQLAATRATTWAKALLTARVTTRNVPVATVTGVIGGAVITAVRRSAGLSRHDLARRAGIALAAIHGWEMGTIPLYCVPYTTLKQLAEALSNETYPSEAILGELVLAGQCDHLIARLLLGDEDFADVPPIDENTTDGAAARQLLRWAFSGPDPDSCRHVAPAVPLLASAASERVASIARDLAALPDAPQVAAYGHALVTLIKEGSDQATWDL